MPGVVGRVKRTPKFDARGGRKGKTDPQIRCPGIGLLHFVRNDREPGAGLPCFARNDGRRGIASLKRGDKRGRDSGFLFF